MKYSLLPVAMAVLLGFIACKSDNKNNENMKQELTLTQEWDKKFRTARRRGAHLHQLHPIEYNNMKKIFLFGAMVCGKTKIIHTYSVCTAKRHDSQETDKVLVEPPVERWDEPAMFDAGYVGMEDVVRAKHMTPVICERGTKGHPLTATQKENNRLKSKTRCRVEHVFGFM